MHEAKFNVHAYAATGEAKSVDTPAINRAIEAVAVAGGGTFVFLTGTYICFTTRLRSDVELSLSRGCVIRNVTDFPSHGPVRQRTPLSLLRFNRISKLSTRRSSRDH